MTYESALVTFSDGYQIRIPLVAGDDGTRSWHRTCRVACDYALVNSGKQYEIEDVVSVRIREATGG